MTEEQINKKRIRHRIYIKEKYHNDKKYRKSQIQASKVYKQNNKYKIYARKYNVSEKEIEALFLKNNNSCWICGSKEKLELDHCHKTNKPRGILCKKCNLLLGQLGDNIENIAKFVKYLIEK